MSNPECDSLKWLFLGIKDRPESIDFFRALISANTRINHQVLNRRSWSATLKQFSVSTSDNLANQGGSDIDSSEAPYIVRRISYKSEFGLAIVQAKDPRTIQIRSGGNYSASLLIECSFDISDVFCLPDVNRLYIFDRSANRICELNLSASIIEKSENNNVDTLYKYGVYKVKHTELTSRIFELDICTDLVPHRISMVQGDDSRNYDQLLLWKSGVASLYTAQIPKPESSQFCPKRLKRSGDSLITPVVVRIACEPIRTTLSHHILDALEFADLAVEDMSLFALVADSSNPRIVEITLPGGSLPSKVIADNNAIGLAISKNCKAQLSSLIAYPLPKYFIDIAISSLDYVSAVKNNAASSSKNFVSESNIRTALSSRHLFLAYETRSNSVILVARTEDGSCTSIPAVALERFPLNIRLPAFDIRITPAEDDLILIWSPASDEYIEINPHFSDFASILAAANSKRMNNIGLRTKRYSKNPDT